MEFGPDASGDGAPRRSAPHLWVPTGTCGRLSSSDNTSQRRRSEPHANSPRMNGWHSTAARLGNPLSAASPRRKWSSHRGINEQVWYYGWRSASTNSPNTRFAATLRGQASGALPGDESLQACSNHRSLLSDTTKPNRFPQRLIDI